MNIYITIISLIGIVFYSGCAQYNVKKPKKKIEQKIEQKREQKTELALLNQKVQKLNVNDKQLIYKSIKDEINRYNKKGDEAYEAGYNYDAIIAYELVNFYENDSTIAIKKIDKIKKTAKTKSKYHYKQALKYSKSNKKRAVIEFNKVMMNDPNYKDTFQRLIVLKNNREIKILLNTLESSLQTKFLNNRETASDLKAISSNLIELLKYDYKNETAIIANGILKKQHKVLVQNALDLYKEGDINKAQKKFYLILSIYKKDATSTKYLNKIKTSKSKHLNLKLAQKSLTKKDYSKSIEYAQKVLNIDSKNKKAKKIIGIAKNESIKKVADLISKGKDYYNHNNLDKAKQSFLAALKIDPDSNTSLIYSKKIERQLKTIKSLQ